MGNIPASSTMIDEMQTSFLVICMVIVYICNGYCMDILCFCNGYCMDIVCFCNEFEIIDVA